MSVPRKESIHVLSPLFLYSPVCFQFFAPAHADEEEEAQQHQRRKQAQPRGDFNDILKKASELKAAQMKDKRRTWEATPDFMRNTMVSTNHLPKRNLVFLPCVESSDETLLTRRVPLQSYDKDETYIESEC